MNNTNPIFSKVQRDTKDIVGYGASYRGILLKTFGLFGVLILSAVGSLFLLASFPQLYVGLLITSIIMAFISVVVASSSTRLAPTFSVIYSVCEGVTLGLLSLIYAAAFPGSNIIFLALIITFGIFAGMLILYSTKLIVVTSRFRRVMLGISFALLATMLLTLIVSFFDGGQLRFMLFGDVNSPLVLFIALLLILYGAFMLVMSFDNAKLIVSSGVDKKYEWQVGLGLIVSTVYIYVQVLRLLAILLSRKE